MMILAAILLLTMFIGFWRIVHGPTRADRLLPVQLFGSTGIALIMIIAQVQDVPRLLDIALVLAILSVVLPAALAEHLRNPKYG